MSGSLSQQNGARWEDYIRAECRALADAKLAFVGKNWEAPKVPGKHVRWETSKPDFSGHLPNGRHVAFEAKALLKPGTSFPFGNITAGQWEQLDRLHRPSGVQDVDGNGISFLYVLNGPEEKWVIPWAQIVRVMTESRSFPLTAEHGELKKRGVETWLDTWNRLDAGGWT